MLHLSLRQQSRMIIFNTDIPLTDYSKWNISIIPNQRLSIHEINSTTVKSYITDNTDIGLRSLQYSIAYGLFIDTTSPGYDEGKRLYGIVAFHFPRNKIPLQSCGPNYSNRIVVVTILHLHDAAPKSAPSYLLSNAISLLVQSFPFHNVFLAYLPKRYWGISFLASNFIPTGITPAYLPYKANPTYHNYGKYENKRLFVRFYAGRSRNRVKSRELRKTEAVLQEAFKKYNPKSIGG